MQAGKIKLTDPANMYGRMLFASTRAGHAVKNPTRERRDKINEVMVGYLIRPPSLRGPVARRRLRYGCQTISVPWSALRVDRGAECAMLSAGSGCGRVIRRYVVARRYKTYLRAQTLHRRLGVRHA